MTTTDVTLHIASMIVQCLPAAQSTLKLLIESHDGAEVGAESEGKMVVLLEATDSHQIIEFIDRIQLEAGVLAANLVYHCEDTEAQPTTQGVRYEAQRIY